jgi:hypothetical protein
MLPSTYRLSDSYIRKKTRIQILGPTVFALVLALFFSAVTTDHWQPEIGLAVGAVTFLVLFHSKNKDRRLAAKQLPAMAIEISPGSLRFVDSGGTYEIPISSIAKVAVDRRADGPRVIYLQRPGESTIVLQGIDRSSQFLNELSTTVGSSKFRDLKWWQGSPR